jgi:hypothetical protein
MARTRTLILLACGALLSTTAALPAQSPAMQAGPSERRLELTFQDGTVTLMASNVTIREILAEWTRKGGTRILNGERLQGPPVTLVFENAPERMVMDSLLRSAAGYVLGPRLAGGAGVSQFGVISILPTSTSVAAASYGGAPMQAPINTRPDDEIPPVTPPIGSIDPNRPVNAPNANPNQPAESQPNRPTVGVPASGVVPIVPITPVPTGTTPPPGGRGRGGRGGGA